MDRIQYREMLIRERRKIANSVLGPKAGSSLAFGTQSRIEQSLSLVDYCDSYTLNSPPTVLRILPLGYGRLGSTAGLSGG